MNVHGMAVKFIHGMDDLKVHGTTGKFMGSWMKSSWDDLQGYFYQGGQGGIGPPP